MELKELAKLIAKLHFTNKDTGESLRVKQIIIKHYKSINRAKNFFMDFTDNYQEIKKALEELDKEGITYFFVVDSYYGNEYLKLYIVNLIKEKPKVIKDEREKMGTDT